MGYGILYRCKPKDVHFHVQVREQFHVQFPFPSVLQVNLAALVFLDHVCFPTRSDSPHSKMSTSLLWSTELPSSNKTQSLVFKVIVICHTPFQDVNRASLFLSFSTSSDCPPSKSRPWDIQSLSPKTPQKQLKFCMFQFPA